MQRMYPRIVYGGLTICLYLEGLWKVRFEVSFILNCPKASFPRSVLVKKPVKANCCCSPCTAHLSLRYMAFVSTSVSGCFHRSLPHYVILPPLCSFGFFQLLWLESKCFDWTFWRKLRDWQSQPSRKHHLLSFSLQNPHRWKSHVFSKFQHFRQKNFGGRRGKKCCVEE